MPNKVISTNQYFKSFLNIINNNAILLHSKLEWEHRGKKIISTMLPQHARYKRTENRFSDKHNIIERRERQVIETSEDGLLNIQRVVKEENGEMYTCIVYSPSGEMARR